VTEKLRPGGLRVTRYDDTHIVGVIDAEKSGTLFLSVPYDRRWRILVDGAERETAPTMGAFTGVELEAGQHTVELVFRPGIAPLAGVVLSAAAAGVVMAVSSEMYKKRKVLILE
jgi:uncharacterized membrane protein YfhO